MMIPPKVIQVIRVGVCHGNGTKENPNRTVMEYYTLEGEYLACDDTWSVPTVMDTEKTQLTIDKLEELIQRYSLLMHDSETCRQFYEAYSQLRDAMQREVKLRSALHTIGNGLADAKIHGTECFEIMACEALRSEYSNE